MCILEAGENQDQGSTEVFCGSVKSFNSRRGFGFLSCEETATRFGRDVYLSKDEAMLLAAEPDVSQLAASKAADNPGTSDKEKTKVPPPVQEGDVLLFRVKLSTEGFPQAVQVKKMRRLQGLVRQAPTATSDGVIIVSGDSGNQDTPGQGADAALEQLLGAEVRLRLAECGQLTVTPNDEIAFCCVSMSESGVHHAWDAQLIDLISTSRPAGALLGCFSLRLPQLKSKYPHDSETGQVCAMVDLEGRAVSDCIFLSKVPSDLGAPDLMRLFSQLGGKEAQVTLGNGRSALGYASIAFDGPDGVAKFLVQSSHTVSEGGVTQLAHVEPCLHRTNESMDCQCGLDGSTQAMEDGQLYTSNHRSTEQTVYPAHEITSEPISTMSLNPEAHAHMSDVNLSFPPPSPLPQGHTFVCMPPPVIHATVPDWRCIHRNVVVPAMAPEMLVSYEHVCSLCMQWPTVVHATSYVVELLNRNSMETQRYLRAPPEGVLPCVMDLRVDSLQPGSYAACVRCIAPCGCESACSPWSSAVVGQLAPPQAAPALHVVLPGVVPHVCPPPPSAPPTFPLAATLPATLPPITEESFEAAGINDDEVLTLD